MCVAYICMLAGDSTWKENVEDGGCQRGVGSGGMATFMDILW